MDYGQLITQAWSITWRHRFLWVLGLFAGGTSTCTAPNFFNWNLGGGPDASRRDRPEAADQVPESLQPFVQPFLDWVTANMGLIILGACLFALLGVAFLIVNLISQGGMARATADLNRERAITLSAAWSAGFDLFWRYLGLWLILIGIAIAVAVVVAIIAAIGFALANVATEARPALIAIGILVGIIAFVAAMIIAILAGIIINYAQRAIAVEDVGPIAALGSGYRLLRANFGTSLIVWLISVGLLIGAGIVIAILGVIVFGILGLLGFIVYSALQLTTGFWVYAALAFAVLVGMIWVASAIANTFLWTYWTSAYLRLSGRLGPPATVLPAA